MNTLIGARSITASTDHVRTLTNSFGGKEDCGARGVPRTFRSTYELEGDPMVFVFGDITQQGGDGIHIIQDHVDVTVVEQVAESRAPSGNHVSQSTACCRRHFLKLCSVQIPEHLRP